MKTISIIFLFLLFLQSAYAQDATLGETYKCLETVWLKAPPGGKSCDVVCTNEDYRAVISGYVNEGVAFNICRADAAKKGKRAGYNLQSSKGGNRCYVYFGDRKGVAKKQYECMCATSWEKYCPK